MNARSSSLGVCRNDSMKSPPLRTAVEVHWWTSWFFSILTRFTKSWLVFKNIHCNWKSLSRFETFGHTPRDVQIKIFICTSLHTPFRKVSFSKCSTCFWNTKNVFQTCLFMCFNCMGEFKALPLIRIRQVWQGSTDFERKLFYVCYTRFGEYKQNKTIDSLNADTLWYFFEYLNTWMQIQNTGSWSTCRCFFW